jgi:hypothetical protein
MCFVGVSLFGNGRACFEGFKRVLLGSACLGITVLALNGLNVPCCVWTCLRVTWFD